MKNKKALYDLTHGMYVVSAKGGACFIDGVSQVSSGDNPLISISIMKKNYTNLILHKEKRFSLSIFGMNDDPEIIKNFGFNSQRDIDKFKFGEWIEVLDTPVPLGMTAYLILETVDIIENDTHTVFIAKVIEADKLKDDKPMTYGYYQENKEELLKVRISNNKIAWVCLVCGYIYYGEEVPNDYICPVCGATKESFKKLE